MTATLPRTRRAVVSPVFRCLGAVAVAWTLACGGAASTSAPVIPASPVGIVGRITSITANDQLSRVALIEFAPGGANAGPRALVTVNGSTQIIVVQPGNGSRFEPGGALSALANGQWVRVWFDGPVADSNPPQATAGTVVVDSLAPSVNP